MISSWFYTKSSSSPLIPILLLGVIISLCQSATASPAGIEAILDPLGDLVQVAPSLALHQEEAEKAADAAAAIKAIKTPAGTVKCSCQTVSEQDGQGDDEQVDPDNFPNDPTKTIEIEIYKQSDEGNDEEEEDEEKLLENERSDAVGKEDDEEEDEEGESAVVPPPLVRNSFMLDDEEGVEASSLASVAPSFSEYSADRLFSTEEPFSFLSYLSSLVSSSAQAQTQSSEQQAQFLEPNEPENIETEAKQEESDQVTRVVNGDINMVNHRMFDTVMKTSTSTPASSSLTTTKTLYKSFRSADLVGVRSVLPTASDVGGSTQEKMDNGNQDDFFLWDFIYADHAGGNKKRERMTLGTVMDPFKGPRRKRRRRALRGNGDNSPVFFVYPVGQQPTSKDTRENEVVIPPENKTKPVTVSTANQKIQVRSSANGAAVQMDQEELHQAMQAAMDRAWAQYGTRGLDAPPVTPAPPSPVFIIPASEEPPPPKVPLPKNQQQRLQIQQQAQVQSRPAPSPNKNSKQQYVYYSPPRPFLFIDRIFNPFQPMESEWDKHVAPVQGPPPPPPEPGFFSRFMASYIDFEVNNHEAADLMRKVVFGIFIGFLLAGWLALGAALGIVPFKKILAWFVGADKMAAKRLDKGKEFLKRDAEISDLTDKILLALDGNWLKRLEERVTDLTEGGGERSGITKIPTQVFCCILPEEETQGMVECQVTKGHHQATSGNKNKKTSPFKCVTDLIYNFHFGPPDVDTEDAEVEQNTVKSKSNNNGEGNQQQSESDR